MSDLLSMYGLDWITKAFSDTYKNSELKVHQDVASGIVRFIVTDIPTGRYHTAAVPDREIYGNRDKEGYVTRMLRELGNKLEHDRKGRGLDPKTGTKMFGGVEATKYIVDEYTREIGYGANLSYWNDPIVDTAPKDIIPMKKRNNSAAYAKLSNYGRY